MTKREKQRIFELQSKLAELGFDYHETEALRRISMTLSRWAERECNGEVEVDDDGRAYSVNHGGPWNGWKVTRYRVPNREAGAKRRLAKILANHPDFTYYHQTDPRGAALYLVNKAQSLYSLQTIDSNYNQIGIPVW